MKDYLRVLVLDDDEDEHHIINEHFQECKFMQFDVENVFTCGEALARIKAGKYHVVLCDYRMPPTNGIDFIKSVRLSNNDVPIILLTGMSDRSIDCAALEAGAAEFIGKDKLDCEMLERTIRYAVANADRQRLKAVEEREAAQRCVLEAALRDELTRLPNRSALNLRLDEMLARAGDDPAELTLAQFDIRGFRDINDIFGYAVGDGVLTETADRIASIVGREEILFRISSDQFMAIISNDLPHAEILKALQRLVDAMKAPFCINGQQVRARLSVGIARFPEHGRTREELLTNLEAATHRAKSKSSESICVYDLSMEQNARQRRMLAFELGDAIARHEFQVHFQPQACVASGEILGYEALARWISPSHGFIPPSRFIPIAEDSGAIHQLGEWVLREACRTAACLPDEFRIAVNVSPEQITHGDVPHIVRQALSDTGLDPNRLELEVTEATVMLDVDRARRQIAALKSMGVSIAIDDFGTGYSSLSSLHTFPIDRIKIDRSFLTNIHGDAQSSQILRTILTLGQNLRVPVLAEGIENREQVDFLMGAGCDEMQGYLIGRPKRADLIIASMRGMDASPPPGDGQGVVNLYAQAVA